MSSSKGSFMVSVASREKINLQNKVNIASYMCGTRSVPYDLDKMSERRT